MDIFRGHTDAKRGSTSPDSALTGRFWGRIWNVECVLELRLDDAGHLQGLFDADGEVLEVALGPPDATGAVRGVIRAHDLAEPFATFRAQPDADGSCLEVNLTDEAEPDPERMERVILVRLG